MKKIAVIPNNIKDIGLSCTKQVIEAIGNQADIYMEDMYRVSGIHVNYTDFRTMLKDADLVIVLGGDGTILQQAYACAVRKIPMLGINLGRIGFMSEVEPDKIEEAIARLFCGDYTIQKRMMMQMEVRRNGIDEAVVHALNDVVVSKSDGTKLIGMEIFTDNELMNKYVADGLIIATPTGSTGYSISAGGPVVDPVMELFVATPICAHMLSARTAVLDAEKTIKIKLDTTYEGCSAVIVADGDVRGYLKAGHEVIIRKSPYYMELIKMSHKSFYDTLIDKL